MFPTCVGMSQRWAESAGDASYNLTVLVQAGMQALDEVCQRKVAREAEAEGAERSIF